MTFQDLNLIEPIKRALIEEGYESPTPIQAQSIPHSLQGKDLLACAQTGTGKTAAFSLPILQILHEEHISRQKPKLIRALILTPTRELAIQIGDSLKAYGRHMRLKSLVVFGGVSQQPQAESLQKGVDILVATPGRLLDLMNQGLISLEHIEIFVLDEADRMLDMGFIHDVRRVIRALPQKRQTLFFSATMPPEIADLAHDILSDPVQVAVNPVSSTAERIDQAVYFVPKKLKKDLLIHLLNTAEIKSALVFTRTKHGANRVAKDLSRAGIQALAIHGNKSQSARQQALQNFKSGNIGVLVATDIAARGIDVEELSHVINYDLPNIPETYVHRIGRTGRAGASGMAFSFCDEEERSYLQGIQKLIGKKIPVISDHPFQKGSISTESVESRQVIERPAPQPGRNQTNRPGNRNRPQSQDRRNKPNHPSQASAERTPDAPNQPALKNKDGRPKPEPVANGSKPADPKNKPPGHEKSRTPKQDTRHQDRRKKETQNQPEPVTNESNKAKQESSTGDSENRWSSLFQKPATGKKGFVIKSDRDEGAKKKHDRRGDFRGKKKR